MKRVSAARAGHSPAGRRYACPFERRAGSRRCGPASLEDEDAGPALQLTSPWRPLHLRGKVWAAAKSGCATHDVASPRVPGLGVEREARDEGSTAPDARAAPSGGGGTRTPWSSPRDHLWERTAKRVGRRRVTATDGAHRTMVNSFVSDTGVEVPAVRALRFRARMSAKGLRLDTWDGS